MPSEVYQWNIDDPTTTKHIVQFLDRIAETRELQENTQETLRSKLNSVLDLAADEWGDSMFYQAAQDPEFATELYEAFEAAILRMKGNRLDTSTKRYLRAVQRWYEWLNRRHLIEYNPIKGLGEEFRWTQDTSVRALTDAEVAALWEQADNLRQYMLVIGYVLWGLRTSELPAAHESQLYLDDEDPYIEFDDRKNGPGTVSIQLGFAYTKEWIEHRRDDPNFDGTLFDASADKLRNEFNDLAARADVLINDKPANPSAGRKYWNERYTEANLFLIEASAEVIPDRGSKDPKVAVEYYTTEELRRKYRRYIFREHIKHVLPDAALPEETHISDIPDKTRLADELQRDLEEYNQTTDTSLLD